MTTVSLAARLAGPLFFPVTAFHPDGSLHPDAYRAHVRAGIEAGAGAVPYPWGHSSLIETISGGRKTPLQHWRIGRAV